MPIELKPLKAQRIDLSHVEDVERERLRVVFENGKVLYFRLSTEHGQAMAPRLVLDVVTRTGTSLVHYDSIALFERLSKSFYHINVRRPWHVAAWQRLRKALDPSYSASFLGWTYEKLLEHFEVSIPLGNDWHPGGIDVYLEVYYGTRNGHQDRVSGLYGKIRSYDSITLPAVAYHDMMAR